LSERHSDRWNNSSEYQPLGRFRDNTPDLEPPDERFIEFPGKKQNQITQDLNDVFGPATDLPSLGPGLTKDIADDLFGGTQSVGLPKKTQPEMAHKIEKSPLGPPQPPSTVTEDAFQRRLERLGEDKRFDRETYYNTFVNQKTRLGGSEIFPR